MQYKQTREYNKLHRQEFKAVYCENAAHEWK